MKPLPGEICEHCGGTWRLVTSGPPRGSTPAYCQQCGLEIEQVSEDDIPCDHCDGYWRWCATCDQIHCPDLPCPPPPPATVQVLDVDQWSAIDPALRATPFATLVADGFTPTSGDAARLHPLGVTHCYVREVRATDAPLIGSVWFTAGPDGYPARYKATIDSSG